MGTAMLPKSDWLELDRNMYQSYVEARTDWLERVVPVTTKRNMVNRYQANEFGNHSPSWNTFEEFGAWTNVRYSTATEAAMSPDKYHLRNRVAGGVTYYNLSAYQAFVLWAQQNDKSQWYCSAMAPKHLLNGEIMRTHEGLYLYYSTVQKPMRDSLKEGGREAKGVTVQFILKHYMNQRSYDWTMMLLDRYPDHVVEFTVVDRCWGTVPGYNTLWWEVRKY